MVHLQIWVACMLLVGVAADGISLAFVFDTTGSMGDELRQVIDGAQSILETALRSTQRDWKNFILVPFNDPKVGPATVTSDPIRFKRELQKINVKKGGDCPEMALGGIKEALNKSEPLSYLYVFTDASAKDFRLEKDVSDLIQQKQCKVIIVLTGKCGDEIDEVYGRITSLSSGQVFEVGKGNVKDILDAVTKTTIEDPYEPPRTGGPTGTGGTTQVIETNLVSVDKNEPTEKGGDNITVSVDTKSSGFTIKLSGDGSGVKILDPQGNEPNASKIETVLDQPKVKFVKVKDPSPGEWTVNIISNSSHTVRIKGSGTLGIDQRFPTRSIGVHFNSAPRRPYSGIPVHVMIKGIGLNKGDKLNNLQFITQNGTVLQDLPLFSTNYNPGIYFTNKTVVPEELFIVQVFGVDDKGKPFKRLSQSALSSITAPGFEQCQKCTTDGTSRCTVLNIPIPSNVTQAKFQCECKAPYFSGDGTKCENVDECALKLDNCDVNANCTDTWGRFRCDCDPGWAGDGVTCMNVDECALGTHSCDPKANCTDTVGSYECTCIPGYDGDGKTCNNTNECLMKTYNCGSNAYCEDTEGGYNCLCNQGYYGDGYTCKKDPRQELLERLVDLKKELESLMKTENKLFISCNLQQGSQRQKRWLDNGLKDWSGSVLAQRVSIMEKQISILKERISKLNNNCTLI